MKEDFSNIFEPSAHKSPKKKKSLPPADPFTTPSSAEEKREASEPVSDEGVQKLLQKIQDIHKEIETKLESVYERNNLSPQKLDAYLAMFSESGYSLAHLKEMHKEQKKLEQRILKAFGGAGKTLSQTHQEQEQSKASKERHAKSLGARKQWIPMR